MVYYRALLMLMKMLSAILYNASQGSVDKDTILDSIKSTLNQFNDFLPSSDKVEIKDFRER